MVSLRRKILFYFFLTAFIVITPLVSMYATGYTIADGFKVKKTGILIVKTNPKDAIIFLNNEQQIDALGSFMKKNKQFLHTPLRIKNLTPKEYQIRIDLDGYWPWEKKLAIEPGRSTFIEDVQLFKKSEATLILPELKKIAYSPDKTKLAFSNSSKLSIIDLTDANRVMASSTITLGDEILWNKKSDKLILGDQVIFADSKKRPISINIATSSIDTRYRWIDAGWLQEKISYCIPQKCGVFSLNNDEREILATGTIKNILVSDNQVYKTVEENSAVTLTAEKSGALIMKIILPKSDYSMTSENGNLFIFDEKFRTLYVADPSSDNTPVKETINNINIFKSVDQNRLIYANDFELWLLDFSTNQKKLLTRQSEPITDLLWHPNNNYIIFSTKKTIKVLELDDREKYNIITLAEAENISDLGFNKAAATLYFVASERFYSLILQ